MRALAEEALALYRGPFLPMNRNSPATLRAASSCGRGCSMHDAPARRWEDAGMTDAAVDCYVRCIDADELCEAYYRT